MFGIDIVELSAALSKRLTRWSPPEIKVTKVINKSTVEIAPATFPFRYDEFWGDDHDHKILTSEEKVRLYLQIHRSTDSIDHVFAIVTALKHFCDTGIPLHYEQGRVTDIWVINADSFDVSDLAQTRSLKMRDPESGVTIRFPITLEGMDVFSNVRTYVRRRFRLSGVGISTEERCKRKKDNKSYENTTPHWWVAAIVEGDRHGIGEKRMVHIDVCAAAYDDRGLRVHEGSVVSLQVFTTPEYSLVPGEKYLGVAEGDVSKKFFITSKQVPGHGGSQQSSLQPKSVRHFRCYHWEGYSHLGVADIDTFLKYGQGSFLGDPTEWLRIISELRHKLVLRVPVHTKIFMCNLVNRSDLNGSTGHVHPSVSIRPPTDRIPVQLEGIDIIYRVKTICLSLTKSKGYTSFSELSMRVQKETEAALVSTETAYIEEESCSTDICQPEQIVMDDVITSYVPCEKESKRAGIQNFGVSLTSDPEVSIAFQTLRSGMITGSHFVSSHFVSGIRKLHSLPLIELLPPAKLTMLQDFLEVIEHPKWPEAVKILKLCGIGKQKAMKQSCGEGNGNGELDSNQVSQFYRLLSAAAEKIRLDKELREIFDVMDRKGFFPNPVNQVSQVEGELLATYMLCL